MNRFISFECLILQELYIFFFVSASAQTEALHSYQGIHVIDTRKDEKVLLKRIHGNGEMSWNHGPPLYPRGSSIDPRPVSSCRAVMPPVQSLICVGIRWDVLRSWDIWKRKAAKKSPSVQENPSRIKFIRKQKRCGTSRKEKQLSVLFSVFVSKGFCHE